MADVTFTITMKDDGTPVLKAVKRASEEVGAAAEKASKATEKAGEAAEKAGRRGEEGFSKWQREILTLHGAVELLKTAWETMHSAFEHTFGGALEAGDTFNKLSQKIAVPVETLSGFS